MFCSISIGLNMKNTYYIIFLIFEFSLATKEKAETKRPFCNFYSNIILLNIALTCKSAIVCVERKIAKYISLSNPVHRDY